MTTIEEKFTDYINDAYLTYEEKEFTVIKKHLERAKRHADAELHGKERLLESFENIRDYCESLGGCSNACPLWKICIERGYNVGHNAKVVIRFLETGEIR